MMVRFLDKTKTQVHGWLLFAFLVMVFLVGCTTPGEERILAQSSPTPFVVDPIGDGLSVTQSAACRLTDLPVIQTDLLQGDLIAWSPVENTLAFIAPVGRSWGWYEGDLVLYQTETGEEQSTRDVKINGDLTWAPDGRRIAFIVFRLPESRYSVMVMEVDGLELFDLYGPAISTDEFSSRKGILEWRDSQNVQVAERCGVDCVRFVEHDLLTGAKRVLEETRVHQDNSLEILLNQPGISPNPNWFNANWSPDGGLVFFSDRNNVAWVADLGRGSRYPLDAAIRRPLESKWSFDSRYLAVRTAERIFVYDMVCP